MEELKRQQISASVMQHMRRMNTVIYADTASVWLELDLTMSQMKVLYTLAHQKSLPIGRVAELLGIGEPSASLLVDKLVKQGLVVRTEDTSDRRRTLAALSLRSEELVTTLRQGSRTRLAEWLSRVPENDLAALDRGLNALATAAEAEEGRGGNQF